MAKQTVNVGASPNDNSGDSIRVAFQKINANFTELYTQLGLDELPLNLGAFEFTGSTITTTDSSTVTIDQATTVTSDLTVGGDILPNTANGGDLGSLAKPWRSLYVSNNTIFIGGTELAVNQSGQLTVNGSTVSGGGGGSTAWNDVTGKPSFATVATSGAYGDLSGRPTIPTLTSQLTNDSGFITAASIPTDFKGSVFADDSTLMIDAVDNKIYATELTVAVGNFVNVNSNNVDVENINGLASQINFTVGGYNNLVIENNLVTIQNVSLSVAGDITLGGNIRSEGAINIDINLTDSTQRIWRFGEDGNLEAPGIISAAGLRTSETEIALGSLAGEESQGSNAIAIGFLAAASSQGTNAVAIGIQAGANFQSAGAVAVGAQAGSNTQGINAVAVGIQAGAGFQGINAVAVGIQAGATNQAQDAVAIGNQAGATSQGSNAIAIGKLAGAVSQPANSIVINASGSVLNGSAAGLYIDPVRNIDGGAFLNYDTATKEIGWSNDLKSDQQISITVAGEDSTQKTWYFGNDGVLNVAGAIQLANGAQIFDTAGIGNSITIGATGTNGTTTFNGTGFFNDDVYFHKAIQEKFTTLQDATGTVTHDCANGSIFYHTSPDANWTVNLTNFTGSLNYATTVTLIISQGGTGYYPNALEIDSSAQTINWQGNTNPTPSSNRVDVVSFSIYRTGAGYTVLGQLTGF